MTLATDLRYALDASVFAQEVLGLELDPWQADVLSSDSRRDLLNCSRQAGKSTVAAVLGLHTSIYKPKSLTLIFSPSQRQSSELFRKIRGFAELLPRRPDLSEDNALSWTVRHGGRVAALPGSDATVRGFSAPSLIIEDEAAFVDDNLHAAVRPMLAVSNGRMILMSTPMGKRGHFWELWSEAEGWTHTSVPAAMVPRIGTEFLEEERRTMAAWQFEQEYMCVFRDSSDSVFRYDDIAAMFTEEIGPLFPEVAHG